ncbi:MAG: nucleoside 2-deoxyribosyltransferase [Candidatus Sulfotelmatobacter sp.]
MPKHFYLSTKKDRLDQATPLLDALEANGWKQTFAWSDHGAQSHSDYADVALAELAGVREADVLIVLLPGGFGTHVEIGAALALGKQIILHAPDRKTLETPYACVFHYHPLVTLLVSEHVEINNVLASLPKPESSA